MKKYLRITALLLIVLMITPLCACGRGEAGTTAEADTAADTTGAKTAPVTDAETGPVLENPIEPTDWGQDPRALSEADMKKAAELLGRVSISSVPPTDGKPLSAKDEDPRGSITRTSILRPRT